jgi:hypothetical protein
MLSMLMLSFNFVIVYVLLSGSELFFFFFFFFFSFFFFFFFFFFFYIVLCICIALGDSVIKRGRVVISFTDITPAAFLFVCASRVCLHCDEVWKLTRIKLHTLTLHSRSMITAYSKKNTSSKKEKK